MRTALSLLLIFLAGCVCGDRHHVDPIRYDSVSLFSMPSKKNVDSDERYPESWKDYGVMVKFEVLGQEKPKIKPPPDSQEVKELKAANKQYENWLLGPTP